MTVACPQGHQSETADYCDQCGARIEGAPAPAPAPAAAPAGAGGAGSSGGAGPAATTGGTALPGEERCPACQTLRVGTDRYCEGCGYDFTVPAARPVRAAASGTTSAPGWQAIATADREYYDRMAPEGVPFPLHCPPRTFLLAGDQIRIGRHSNSRGIQPEVDLSGAPEDAAISHLHCILVEQPDGSYSLVDPGSTNGTTLNDDPTPLMANVAVPVADGDHIHLGAWTTITISALKPAALPATS